MDVFGFGRKVIAEGIVLRTRWQRLLKAAEAFVAVATGRSTVVILTPVKKRVIDASHDFGVEDPRFVRDPTLN